MLQNILLWTILVCGIYQIGGAFIMKTKDFWSSLLFKFIPFVFGVACVLYFLATKNVVVIH
jgi:uncharacterized membrane protein HdeD (DUF308 family)